MSTSSATYDFHYQQVWADENPGETLHSRHQWQFSTNMWSDTAGDKLLESYFLPPHLTGLFTTIYYEAPFQILQRCGSADQDSLMVYPWWYSRTLSSCSVSGTMHETRWKKKKVWPAHSSHLNPLGLYRCGHLKMTVYITKGSDTQDIQLWMQNTFEMTGKSHDIFQYTLQFNSIQFNSFNVP